MTIRHRPRRLLRAVNGGTALVTALGMSAFAYLAATAATTIQAGASACSSATTTQFVLTAGTTAHFALVGGGGGAGVSYPGNGNHGGAGAGGVRLTGTLTNTGTSPVTLTVTVGCGANPNGDNAGTDGTSGGAGYSDGGNGGSSNPNGGGGGGGGGSSAIFAGSSVYAAAGGGGGGGGAGTSGNGGAASTSTPTSSPGKGVSGARRNGGTGDSAPGGSENNGGGGGGGGGVGTAATAASGGTPGYSSGNPGASGSTGKYWFPTAKTNTVTVSNVVVSRGNNATQNGSAAFTTAVTTTTSITLTPATTGYGGESAVTFSGKVKETKGLGDPPGTVTVIIKTASTTSVKATLTCDVSATTALTTSKYTCHLPRATKTVLASTATYHVHAHYGGATVESTSFSTSTSTSPAYRTLAVTASAKTAPTTTVTATTLTYGAETQTTFAVEVSGLNTHEPTGTITLQTGTNTEPVACTKSASHETTSTTTYTCHLTTADELSPGLHTAIVATFTPSEGTTHYTSTTTTPPVAFTVYASPLFTSSSTAHFPLRVDTTFTITTTGYPTATITERGTLPSGLSFETNGDGTATISGTPSPRDKRSSSIKLTATNGVTPPGVQRLTIDIGTRPVY